MKLTAEQTSEVTSRTSYPKSAWGVILDQVAAYAPNEGEGKIEAKFPGVKPAHVAHMLRLTIKANPAKYAKLTVAKHPKYGVVVTRGQ